MERKLAEFRARKKGQTEAKKPADRKPNTCPQMALAHLTLLKVLLWLVLLGLFSELEFGLPFFVISLFYWLYEGLRSPKLRQPGEMSTYSLEGEMGYRSMANR
uniref:SAYSvFN domain-containing protein n=1 Tax=Sinocyclocheilus rhinocerous TaxID=307959 RepID=A0A673HTH9_9TELE